jgi:putative molybdopterin biosynthesis protein
LYLHHGENISRTDEEAKTMYLEDIPLPDAQSRLNQALDEANLAGILGQEKIPLDELAIGRILAEPIWAKISSPHYHAAAMDGFAVKAVETEGALATLPVTLLAEEQAVYIDTGDPLPEFADAVIPIENVEPLNSEGSPAVAVRQPHAIRIRSAVSPWMHVRTLGEDIVATQLVLPAGHKLRPIDLGVIAASGNSQVHVARRPRVAILPTGSELVQIGSRVSPGEIIEFNSLVLAAQVEAWGGEATRLPITQDDFELICARVSKAAKDNDLILVNAGSSAGSEDFTARVVQELGDLFVHGVAVRPGHPVILGMIESHEKAGENKQGVKEFTPVIGVPGYPVSAAITGEIFVEPLIAKWLGRASIPNTTIQATLTRKITSPAGDDDFVRVAVGQVGERVLAAPLARGAGVITSLVRADGLALLPRGSQGLPAGSELEVRLYRSPDDINKTIFATGSHDITLDLIAQFLHSKDRRLTAANVGSIAGLVALSRNEAHLAGSHLLDPETGEFNLSYVEQYLPDIPVMIIALVGRSQGLLIPKGNPKHIHSLTDLTRRDVTFVNRQRGAGTRFLLDYQLEQLGIAKGAVRGYQNQEFTHLAVGAAIASGRADCGIGIAAVTQSLELDFIPLFEERYDLIIPQEFARSSLLEPLFSLFENHNFRKMVASLPGYDITPMGNIIAELPARQE